MLREHDLHRVCLFIADVFIRARHAAEQIGEARQVVRPRGVEAIERIEDLAQRRGLGGGRGLVQPEPAMK